MFEKESNLIFVCWLITIEGPSGINPQRCRIQLFKICIYDLNSHALALTPPSSNAEQKTHKYSYLQGKKEEKNLKTSFSADTHPPKTIFSYASSSTPHPRQ